MAGKLSIEIIIKEKMASEKQKPMLDFVSSLQEIGITFEGFNTEDINESQIRFGPKYKGEGIGAAGIFDMNDDVFFVLWLGIEFKINSNEATESLKEFVWSNVVACPQEPCKSPYCNNCKNPFSIFGKDFASTCHAPLAFINPDAEALEKIKEMFLETYKNV